MADINTNLADQNVVPEENGLDIKMVLSKIINYWYLFVLSVAVCLALAYIKASLAQPIWNITGKIIVQEDETSSRSTSALHAGLATLPGQTNNLENEVEIMRSTSLVYQLVSQTNLNIKTYEATRFKTTEIYSASPFKIGIGYKKPSIRDKRFEINIVNNDEYTLKNKEDKVFFKARFGDSVDLKQYNLILTKSPAFKKGSYLIDVQSVDEAAGNFLNNFQAMIGDKTSSAINIGYNYTEPERGQDVLEQLMKIYLVANLQNKLRTADSTLKFIDTRLAVVQSELFDVQKKFEDFKKSHNMVDIADKKALVGNETNLATAIKQQDIQLAIVNDLEKYLKDPHNSNRVPTSVTVSNGTLNSGIDSYNAKLL
jgi:tyrosine-protein kinase Etk/Wzc